MTVPAAPEDPYSDPNELFDVYRSDGTPTGVVKRRADVHRDGDWHRSFHCWVTCLASDRSGTLLILQRRGLYKDTWPGRLDASVGGHYRAGETLRDVVREVEEEIGQGVKLEDLIPLGHRVAVSEPDGVTCDRELQDIFLWRAPLPLDAFRPQPVEVAALEAVAVSDLLRLFTGAAPVAPAVALTPDGRVSPREVRVEDFIPTFDRYFYRMAVLVDLAARDYPHLVA